MAFIFSSSTKPNDGHVKVDIICVPAIGADPRKTWARQHNRLDDVLQNNLKSDAQIYFYDHLTHDERRVEIKPAETSNDQAHKQSAKAFALAEAGVAKYGIAEWADRFLEALQGHRRSQNTDHRPIVFICHSTGGVVVKQALSRKPTTEWDDIASFCLAVTFFASPHHGSSVLSEAEYVQTVRDHLELKWEMSETLRHDLTLRNTDLETLNYKFAVRVVGVKIYSYVESTDTTLAVLSTNDIGGETLTDIKLCIVDSRSGKLSTSEVPVEDEEVIHSNTTHVGAPIFMGQEKLYEYYINELTFLVKNFSPEERAAYHDLNNKIMTGIEVDVHQFYEVNTQGPGSMKILSAHPCLQTFLELGPSKCMEDRVQGMDGVEEPRSNGSIRPTIELRPASEPAAPTFTVTTVESDKPSKDTLKDRSIPTIAVPTTVPFKNMHTKRPSVSSDLSVPGSPGHLRPKAIKTVQFKDRPNDDERQMLDSDKVRRPQKKRLFQLPNPSSARFKWIHVPFTHAGWVPHVLTTISQEKEDLGLHSKVLMDKMWFSQHNRSRHASPHARFVRPSIKCLFPKRVERSHTNGITTPASATDDIQFVAYLPYLHWDSFKNLQKRAEIIKRRRKQVHARPVAKDVAWGKSMEHKLIWQYLTSDRPVHCRRTLDQYGYPSLRNTSVRDGDQILYKRTKADADIPQTKAPILKHKHRTSAEGRFRTASVSTDSSGGNAPADNAATVLMVDQMWLWIIDSRTVITFFAPKEKEDDDNGLSREGDLRSEMYRDINGDYANQCVDPYDFAALAVLHAIKALLDRTTDQNLQVFRIFEEYISILTEQQNSSFKHFRNNHRFERAKDTNAQSHIDNRKDLDALLELRDIQDELNTIDKLIKEQQTCVSDMIIQYNHLIKDYSKGINGISFLYDVQQFLNEHKEQVESMLKGAIAAQRAFKELLDMKQKQANIVEAHLAREQTEVAADQSRSVMIFTIFTIIFLPLSFFASVFGINSREWTGGKYPHLHTIFTYMGCISLAVIIVALLVAFNKYTRRISQRLWKAIAIPFVAVLQRLGILQQIPGHESGARANIAVDLEKANAVDKERAEARRLSTISRTYSKMNWEDELKLHRQSIVGFKL